jgi:hypothetical protein
MIQAPIDDSATRADLQIMAGCVATAHGECSRHKGDPDLFVTQLEQAVAVGNALLAKHAKPAEEPETVEKPAAEPATKP